MGKEAMGPESASGGDSVPPEAKGFYARAKAAAAVITALTALIAAVTALVKTMDTSLQKASYEELAESIKKISVDNQKQYDDLKAIHEYIDKDREIRKAAASAVPSASEAPTSRPSAPVPPSSARPKATAASPPAPPPAPPSMAPKAAPVVPRAFRDVEKGVEKAAAK